MPQIYDILLQRHDIKDETKYQKRIIQKRKIFETYIFSLINVFILKSIDYLCRNKCLLQSITEIGAKKLKKTEFSEKLQIN